MRAFIIVLCALLSLSAPCATAHGAPDKDSLKERFRSRESELRSLKERGRVGETVEGYVEAVEDADGGVARVVREENEDRRALYQILADEINAENPSAPVKASAQTIAQRNALRNIERSGPDEMLRVSDGRWIRVRDFPRAQELLKLKTQGRVGETASGLVEIVRDSDRADAALSRIVEEENARRAAEYQAMAQKERADAGAIAKRVGARNIASARVGDMVKDERGAWRRK